MKLEIEEIGGNCPLQAEGTVDGFGFYFRARGNRWSLHVKDGTAEGWLYTEQYPGGEYAAGWMEEDEALAFIAQASQKFTDSRSAA